MKQRVVGTFDDDGLMLAAALVRPDAVVKFDPERQPAQVLRETAGYAGEGVFGEVTPTYDLEHHGAVRALHGLKLAHDFAPRIAEQDVKNDAGHDVTVAVSHDGGAPPVNVRLMFGPARETASVSVEVTVTTTA